MPINFRISALVPVGLIVESVIQLEDSIRVTARAGIQVATCPLCGSPSRRVHSRYVREVSDLPCSGRSIRLRVVTRRFCCDIAHCRRRIFAERFDNTVLLVRSHQAGLHHPSSRIGSRREAGSKLRQTTDATSQQ
jgi:transposase